MDTVAVADIPEDFTGREYRINVEGVEYRVGRWQGNVMVTEVRSNTHMGEVYRDRDGWTRDGAPVDATLALAILRLIAQA